MSSQTPLHNTLLQVGSYTALWALPLFIALVLAANPELAVRVSYPVYFRILWSIGIVLVLLILFGSYRASKFIPPRSDTLTINHWYQDSVLVALLVFWALGPPSYFFVEYYAFDQGLIECREPSCSIASSKAACLSEIKTYSDLASKFWAGAAAVFVATTALAKNAA